MNPATERACTCRGRRGRLAAGALLACAVGAGCLRSAQTAPAVPGDPRALQAHLEATQRDLGDLRAEIAQLERRLAQWEARAANDRAVREHNARTIDRLTPWTRGE